MDPMVGLINSLPGGAPAQSQQDQEFQQGGQPFGGYSVPAQVPVQPQYPVYQQPVQQPQPMQQMVPQVPAQQQPQWQQPAQQQPQYAQPGQQQQAGVPGEYVIPQIQMPAQDQQVPDWAQGIVQNIQELNQKVVQPAQDGAPWDDNNRPRTWEELQKSIETMADKKADAKLTAWQQQQQAAAVAEQQQAAQANQQLDFVENQLRTTGLLPQIVNAQDPNDPGVQAKRELYAYTVAMGGSTAQHLAASAPALKALHDGGTYFDYTQNKFVRRGSQTAAAQAPIAGGAPVMGGMAGAQVGPSQGQLGMGYGQLMELGMSRTQ